MSMLPCGPAGRIASTYDTVRLAGRCRFSFTDDPSLDTLRDRFDTRSDGEAATRLGLKDVRLRFTEPFVSPFANPIAVATVPGYIVLALGLIGDQIAVWTRVAPHTVALDIDGHGARFTYDPLGLDITGAGDRS